MMELATGHFPYEKENLKSPFEMVPLLLEEPSPTLPSIFTLPFRDFVQLCLIKDPVERPPASSLLVFILIYLENTCCS
jgi:serine/threonine-protein kinase 24/25/MST4